MDVRALLLELIAPTAIGDELAPGVRLARVADDLGPRLTFALADGAEVDVEVSPATAGLRHAARTAHLTLAYRGRAASAVGAALCATVAARIGDRDAGFVAALAAAGAADAPRVREVTVDHLLELAGPPAARFYTCSPYVGCLIGCRFCYAQERLAAGRAAAGLPMAPWGSWVDVRVNAAAVLADELARLPRYPIKFCPIVSDPYHAIEARLGLTRACLAAIAAAAAPPPVLLLTRAALVTRDLDLLAALPWAGVGVSLPTIDDDVRAHFEPRAAPIAARLATLAAIRAAGVAPIAVGQPMLPGPVDALADALAAHVDSVSLDVLRGEGRAGPLFDDPRFAAARAAGWQTERLAALTAALAERRVPVWSGELPPNLTAD
ncbi:MAG: radical SAM protein [Myxococcales bacterium]|nr:radical SAM protein [Myxococcales bacterium]MBP6847594.1 radical SAM protein [Kofleriaceae bacterium]